MTDDIVNKVRQINSLSLNTDEKNRQLDDVLNKYKIYVSKMKISEETMYSMLFNIAKCDDKIKLRLMKILYDYDSSVFLKAFIHQKF